MKEGSVAVTALTLNLNAVDAERAVDLHSLKKLVEHINGAL